jgi:PAS domain S-box-containing protein
VPHHLMETRRVASRDTQGPRPDGRHPRTDIVTGSESGELLSLVLDHTPDGVLLADERAVIVYANRSLHRLFGYADGDLVGRPINVLIPDDVRVRHRSQVKRFQKHPRPRQMGREDLDIEGRRFDGSFIAVDVQLDALPGTPLVMAAVRDVAEQRRSSVDRAIDQLDLATARGQVTRLQASLDHVIQRLFALGTSIEAGSADQADEDDLSNRLAAAVDRIDQIIEAVQQGRKPDSGRER